MQNLTTSGHNVVHLPRVLQGYFATDLCVTAPSIGGFKAMSPETHTQADTYLA